MPISGTLLKLRNQFVAAALTVFCTTGCGSDSPILDLYSGLNTTPGHIWVAPDGADENIGTAAAPLQSLEQALKLAKNMSPDNNGEIVIHLGGGVYRLERPLQIDASTLGAGIGLAFEAESGSHPVIVGSKPVTGWELKDANKNIYSAQVGPVRSRQLFVNGKRAIRARTLGNPAAFLPAFRYREDGQPVPQGIEFIPSDLNPPEYRNPAQWSQASKIEAVMITQWKMMRVPIASVIGMSQFTPDPILQNDLPPDTRTGLLVMQEPAWTNANVFLDSTTKQPGIWSFYMVNYFENAYQFLDQEGEWYLDESAGELFYKPRAGEDMATAQVELPLLERLVQAEHRKGLRFKGIGFSFATWNGPSQADGYVADQSGFLLTGHGNETNTIGHARRVQATPGNLTFKDCLDLEFEDCTFEHLGGVALSLPSGVQASRIHHCSFNDISSSAIVLSGVSPEDARPSSAASSTVNVGIDHNTIKNTGVDYVDSAAIFVGFSQGTLVTHNDISNVPWSGIALGWGWGLLDDGMFPGLPDAQRGQWGAFSGPTQNRNNVVSYNRIHRFLQAVWDGGAIYSTGFQGTSVSDGLQITGNVAFDKRPSAGGNTFYTDGGSRYVTLTGNASYANPVGVTDFGSAPHPDDPLPNTTLVDVQAINGIPYGTDAGGCVTFGDISYVGNYTQSPFFFDVCPFEENGVFYPVNLTSSGNQLILSVSQIPTAILEAAGP